LFVLRNLKLRLRQARRVVAQDDPPSS